MRLSAPLLKEVSRKMFVLDTLTRDLWRKSCWRLQVGVSKEVSREAPGLQTWHVTFWTKSRAKRWFWRLVL